jgi:hypothetical protein
MTAAVEVERLSRGETLPRVMVALWTRTRPTSPLPSSHPGSNAAKRSVDAVSDGAISSDP